MNLVVDPRVPLLYHYCRIQRPRLVLDYSQFTQHVERMFERARHMQPDLEWNHFLSQWQVLDSFLVAACMEKLEPAWEQLFCAKVGRADRMLLDALRSRAARLYPRQEYEQEAVVNDFWGQLLVPANEGSLSILACYDGLRPLVPWLLRVFQNRNISHMRSPAQRATSLGEDDKMESPIQPEMQTSSIWHELFRDAARSWLSTVTDHEMVLLGLRWRYQLSQREAAQLMKVHEGTLSRQMDKLRERCVTEIQSQLETQGWTGDDIQGYILSEMAGILLDDSRLSIASLSKKLKQMGIEGVKEPVQSSV